MKISETFIIQNYCGEWVKLMYGTIPPYPSQWFVETEDSIDPVSEQTASEMIANFTKNYKG